MQSLNEWDWEISEKLITDINEWGNLYNWVEEPYASPDGEKIAAGLERAIPMRRLGRPDDYPGRLSPLTFP